MTQHLKFPRMAAGSVLAVIVIVLVLALIGGSLTAEPAHALQSNWQKMHVVNHPTSVTIDFVATRTYGPDRCATLDLEPLTALDVDTLLHLALGEVLGHAFKPALEEAWSTAYHLVSDAMRLSGGARL